MPDVPVHHIFGLLAVGAIVLSSGTGSTGQMIASAQASVDIISDDPEVARSLAALLRASRSVISANQSLINNPDIGDKGLSGRSILALAISNYKKTSGIDITTINPKSRQGSLIKAEMDSIVSVIDMARPSIDKKGTAFKGFIPAIFARLVGEEFTRRANGKATIKVTAPDELVRNRKARPDALESDVITTKFLKPDWRPGEPYSVTDSANGKTTFRMMVPDYYVQSCLDCHGSPKNSLDITGYPREGANLGDLGGVISITLYR